MQNILLNTNNESMRSVIKLEELSPDFINASPKLRINGYFFQKEVLSPDVSLSKRAFL